MGGTVAETIRRENGEVIKMARKTGAYNWMFFTKEFCEKKFDVAIDDHIKSFIEMREDYLSGEPYKYNMTPVYGWCDETFPVDYGLVVIDFQKKKIHSMQGYDRPGYYYASMLSSLVDKEVKSNFDYLLKNNLLLTINYRNEDKNDTKDIKELFGDNFSFKKLITEIDSFFSKSSKIFNFKYGLIDLVFSPKVLSEFEFIKYEETPEGTLLFLKALINDEFSLTPNDFEGWREKINNFDVDYFLSEEDYHIEDDALIDKIITANRERIIEEIIQLENNQIKTMMKLNK